MPKIKACPDKPNCVYSLGTSDYSKIKPLPYFNSQEESKKKIIEVMQRLPRTKLVKNEGDYLHFTCKTKLLRFTDDIEFEIDNQNKVIHVKSASRLGYRDFDVNRERVEKIRSLLK